MDYLKTKHSLKKVAYFRSYIRRITQPLWNWQSISWWSRNSPWWSDLQRITEPLWNWLAVCNSRKSDRKSFFIAVPQFFVNPIGNSILNFESENRIPLKTCTAMGRRKSFIIPLKFIVSGNIAGVFALTTSYLLYFFQKGTTFWFWNACEFCNKVAADGSISVWTINGMLTFEQPSYCF